MFILIYMMITIKSSKKIRSKILVLTFGWISGMILRNELPYFNFILF